MEEYEQMYDYAITAGYHQLAESLLGLSGEDPFTLTGSALDNDVEVDKRRKSGTNPDQVVLLMYHYPRMMLLYISRSFEKADAELRQYIGMYGAETGLAFTKLFGYFFNALTSHAMARLNPRKSRSHQALAQKYTSEISKLVTHDTECPVAGHMLHLLDAEKLATLVAIKGPSSRIDEVIKAKYDLAVQEAEEGHFFLSKAIALERAADYYEAVGDTSSWEKYIKRAYQAYLDYGAVAKMEQLRSLVDDRVKLPANYQPSDAVMQEKMAPHMLSV